MAKHGGRDQPQIAGSVMSGDRRSWAFASVESALVAVPRSKPHLRRNSSGLWTTVGASSALSGTSLCCEVTLLDVPDSIVVSTDAASSTTAARTADRGAFRVRSGL